MTGLGGFSLAGFARALSDQRRYSKDQERRDMAEAQLAPLRQAQAMQATEYMSPEAQSARAEERNLGMEELRGRGRAIQADQQRRELSDRWGKAMAGYFTGGDRSGFDSLMSEFNPQASVRTEDAGDGMVRMVFTPKAGGQEVADSPISRQDYEGRVKQFMRIVGVEPPAPPAQSKVLKPGESWVDESGRTIASLEPGAEQPKIQSRDLGDRIEDGYYDAQNRWVPVRTMRKGLTPEQQNRQDRGPSPADLRAKQYLILDGYGERGTSIMQKDAQGNYVFDEQGAKGKMKDLVAQARGGNRRAIQDLDAINGIRRQAMGGVGPDLGRDREALAGRYMDELRSAKAQLGSGFQDPKVRADLATEMLLDGTLTLGEIEDLIARVGRER